MKKILIITISLIIIAVAVGLIFFCQKPSGIADENTIDSSFSQTDIDDITEEFMQDSTKAPSSGLPGMNSLLTVDSWLKICSVEEIDGKIAVIAENISDNNVEYALLTLYSNVELKFNASALLSGEKVYLVADKEYSADIADNITFGKTENVIFYSEVLSLNDDVLAISIDNDNFAVRNITDTDITSEITIYYKEIRNNIQNGSITGRIRLNGLAAGAVTYVKTDGLNNENCRIIFTEYD